MCRLTSKSRDMLDGMLVFAPWNLDTILDIFITSYRPVAQPAERRGLPAVAIHRYACFAVAHWELEELESLLYGAVERIEKEIDVSTPHPVCKRCTLIGRLRASTLPD